LMNTWDTTGRGHSGVQNKLGQSYLRKPENRTTSGRVPTRVRKAHQFPQSSKVPRRPELRLSGLESHRVAFRVHVIRMLGYPSADRIHPVATSPLCTAGHFQGSTREKWHQPRNSSFLFIPFPSLSSDLCWFLTALVGCLCVRILRFKTLTICVWGPADSFIRRIIPTSFLQTPAFPVQRENCSIRPAVSFSGHPSSSRVSSRCR
jgi:hypothetical protein